MQAAKPADFMTPRTDRSIPLHVAIESNAEKALLAELIARTPDINVPGPLDHTALHLASRKGDLATVRLLLKRGADVKAAAHHGIQPIHYAVNAGHVAIAKLLVAQGSDPMALAGPMDVDEPDGNAVDLARRTGNFRLARMLMDPLRSSLAMVLHKVKLDDGDAEADDKGDDAGTSVSAAIMFEPVPGPLEDGTCSICGDEEKLLPLSRCGHKFCCGCLESWFEARFNGIRHPSCPSKDCGMVASYYDLRACMKNPARYEEQALRKVLMDIREFRWCPKCGCGGIVPCSDAICAQCKFHFCAECMLEAHPLSCAENLQQMLAGERGKRRAARQLAEIQESTKWIE
jgi:hypothetical protein